MTSGGGGGGFITFVQSTSSHLPEPPEYLPEPEYNNGISHISPLENYWHFGPIFILEKIFAIPAEFPCRHLLLLLAGLQDLCCRTLQPSLKLHPHLINCQV